nr:amidase [Rhodococcus sp. 06-621-2]
MTIWTESSVTEIAELNGLDSDGRVVTWLNALDGDAGRTATLRDLCLPAEGELGSNDKARPPLCDQYAGGEAGPLGDAESPHDVDPTTAVEQALDRAAGAAKLNAFTAVLADRARADASNAELCRSRGADLPLYGMTVGVKDIIAVAGHAMTAGTPSFTGHDTGVDAASVARVVDAGAAIIGATNLQALAFGASGAGSLNGPVVNPIAEQCFTGGSSGGSAAAVAAGVVDAAIGTDTGGSIRIPSALCGVVGLKPTYGLVPTSGVHPVSSTLDHVGPIARSVSDVARLLDVMSGRAGADALTVWSDSLDGVVVGAPTSWFEPMLDDEIKEAWTSARAAVLQLGGTVVDVEIPSLKFAALAQWAIIAPDAFDSNSALLRTKAADLPDDVRLRLELGMFRSATTYVRAQRIRRVMAHESRGVLQHCDVLMWPTVPVTAPAVGTGVVELGGDSVDVSSALTALTIPYNLTGLPAVTLPWGRSSSGGGMGMQIGGGLMRDADVLSVAHTLESNRESVR